MVILQIKTHYILIDKKIQKNIYYKLRESAMENKNEKLNYQAKNWVFPFLLGLFCVLFLDMVFEIINNATYNDNFWAYISTILTSCVHMAIIFFGIYAWNKQKENWFKVFFLVYFSYLLCVNALSCFYYIEFLSIDTLYAFYGITKFILTGIVVTIGILFLINHLQNKGTYRRQINILSLSYLIFDVLLFILMIIMVAKNYINWAELTEPIKSAMLMIVFLGYFNKDIKPVVALSDSNDANKNEQQEVQQQNQEENVDL